MTKTLFILGRQPIFGIAELESLFPDNIIEKMDEKIVSIDRSVDPNLINKLGGTIKIAEEVIGIQNLDKKTLEVLITENVLDALKNLPTGKITFGISYYGNSQTVRDIEIIALKIKKSLKQFGRSVRIVPNNEFELSSAQVFHNRLTKDTGFELIIIDTGKFITFARSITVQNIESYSSRDQKRPYRDARVGMLPPKLAQIMINLLCPLPNQVVLDPFCGTGVILQEALLMNLRTVGSDLDHRMVNYSTLNIEWLRQKYNNLQSCQISDGDATNHHWPKNIDCVVTEAYLGKPFFQNPSINSIDKEKEIVNDLLLRFLKNIHSQINAGTKLCIAIPTWRYNNQFIHLSILDQIDQIGYNPMSFKNLETEDLIYYRPDQIVARQILLLIRK
ncbi:MAG TPA: DNA methyltransferase [Candidatus Dormibacteraeota bacterium]|nr:DNA methyltransferase [Candidatus Dormibacteraeota bacterium]